MCTKAGNLDAARGVCYNPSVYATLAQLVERRTRNAQVAGSIPAGGSIVSSLCGYRIVVIMRPSQGREESSILSTRTSYSSNCHNHIQ